MFDKDITMREVAKMAGVSIATVSKYLDGIKVKDINKERIEKSIETLGYRRNEIARGLKTRKSYTIGVLVPSFKHVFFMEIISSLEDYLQARGYSAIICSYKESPEEEDKKLSFIANKMVDGIIVASTGKNNDKIEKISRQIPTVLIDRLPEGMELDSVSIDNFKAGYEAAKILIEKGHTNIGLISAAEVADTLRKRHEGFIQALKDNNIKINEKKIGYSNLNFSEAMTASQKILSEKDRPTALVVANYDMTIGAIMAINKLGLQIPEDISIVGFDNLELSKIIKPELTIIEQPVKVIGETAGRLILERAKKDPRTEIKHEVIQFNIHNGFSVKQLK
ncbi:MAG: LacI family DNA-binding transcriptional regulator [Spirochaetales bacterium]|nr:LacI family DNA-binding transcriptional regulator [Spirochaetales bacterium]